ncbi:hypothetical protein E9531_00855 [Lampropedia puyangensis]|uniref:ATP synthase n=1 Tax=Lampropedia puyangensis TaxID=1330072 RepID=A0A4S8FDU4_9BURK|nr:SbcC/MukB-like Walker B domain-containing protein [Lampropedia puyangensis]THU05135.1 hypothetical protein E9531_00855 [Lampropedia puyangensis]
MPTTFSLNDSATQPAKLGTEAQAPAPSQSYILESLTLYNWGAFQGLHTATMDAANTAIIGATGSGKTTVVDALMTLLCDKPRYNLASTGGHESDRDLASYVRGVSGQGTDGSSAHIARSGKTATAISARIAKSEGEYVLLGALLWFDGSSSSASDMSKRWFFIEGSKMAPGQPAPALEAWLEELQSGGARALSKLAKDTEGLHIWTSKSAYLAKLQSYFEVGSNAFTLLNRAAGLKQLNSIDDIFRELVLEEHAAFDEALKVASGFDKLTDIHAELELAQSQLLSLLPLRDLALRHREQSESLHALKHRAEQLPLWFAMQGQALWSTHITVLEQQWASLDEQVKATQQAQTDAQDHANTLLQLYLQAGGGSIQQLQSNIRDKQSIIGRLKQHIAQYQTLCSKLALSTPPVHTATTLAQHQRQASSTLQALEEQRKAQQAALEMAITQERNAHQRLTELKAERDAVRQRPGSNIPMRDQQFRHDLAQHLQLAVDELPFVAELLEVQKNQQLWRGAIERALGSQRLRIMVPSHAMRDALQWVNQRHNRVHVRLLEVPEQAVANAPFWEDGFCTKLNIKPHAFEPALRRLLGELDRHCVASAEALQHTSHGMTAQGLMSGKARHFDKQDQKRLEDDWMTGFDNRDRLARLEASIEQAQASWKDFEQTKAHCKQQQSQLASTSILWQSLQKLQFEDLDITPQQTQLETLELQLAQLQDPQSHAGQAKQRWEDAENKAKALSKNLLAFSKNQSALDVKLEQAQKSRRKYRLRLEQDASDHAAQQPASNPMDDADFVQFLPLKLETLDEQERTALKTQLEQLQKAREQLHGLEKTIVNQMGKAKREDRGALQEELSEVSAVPAYLERLRVIEEEALPEKQKLFQAYLNESSGKGVNGLLSGIDAQVTEIKDRLDALNRTMAKVDFQPGRYLQLNAIDVTFPVLKEINGLLAQWRSARTLDDGGQSLYLVLRGIVDLLREHANNRRTKAAQALLDPRYRLQFFVYVHDRASGEILERRTGSQGGSGGEKEIIASYVLTASLSYALCPQGRTAPLFGTIVLDEAFSKSSQAVAGRIIQALREFGLHALFVTPNKEMRLLRTHTRSAIIVHRKGSAATLTSIAWEQLEAIAHNAAARVASGHTQPAPITPQPQ